MSAAMINLINQLDSSEEKLVLDFTKKLIANRNSLDDDRKVFYSIREEALSNRPDGMSLDEINSIIKKARSERYAREINV